MGIISPAPNTRQSVLGRGTTQTASMGTPALRLLQGVADASGLLGGGATFEATNGSTSWLLGGICGTVGTPGNPNGYPGGLAFFYKLGDGAAPGTLTEGMRLTMDGNWGVGTKTPTERLDVVGNGKVSGTFTAGAILAYNQSAANNYDKVAAYDFWGRDTVGAGKLVGFVRVSPVDPNYVSSTLALACRRGDIVTTVLTLGGSDAAFAVPIRSASYTVAALPTAGVAGRMAYATNGRAYNGAGTLEGSGAGTGCLVTDTGSAWRVVGTNQTVQA